SVAVLFPEVGSGPFVPSSISVTVLASWSRPAAAGLFTVTANTAAPDAPAVSEPTASVNTPDPGAVSVQPGVLSAGSNVVPAGSASTSTTPVAMRLPAFR